MTAIRRDSDEARGFLISRFRGTRDSRAVVDVNPRRLLFDRCAGMPGVTLHPHVLGVRVGQAERQRAPGGPEIGDGDRDMWTYDIRSVIVTADGSVTPLSPCTRGAHVSIVALETTYRCALVQLQCCCNNDQKLSGARRWLIVANRRRPDYRPWLRRRMPICLTR